MVGAFPAEPLKGPIAMHAAQKVVPRRVPVVAGPTQSFFMREAKALGVSQSPCIPHPRDSLASRSSCYRPGTGFNLTRRYLIQHEVFFMSDMGCGAGGVVKPGMQRLLRFMLPCPDPETCTVRGLHPNSSPVSQYTCHGNAGVVGKMNLKMTKVLGP